MRELQIGAQFWTIDNLDITNYRNGDPISHVQDEEDWRNLKTGAWCYFENNIDNNEVYGKLYNYYAISDPRGLAPVGYRVPQHYDWLELRKFGGRLKSKNEWSEKTEFDFYVPFNAKPGGNRDSDGKFNNKKSASGWWASAETDVRNQGNIAHWLYENDPQLGWKPYFENSGFYVRCIKETYRVVKFFLNDNLQLEHSSISLKYSSSTTFQEILNMLYKTSLKDKVSAYSYGKEWIIEIYDGVRIEKVDWIENLENRIFEHMPYWIYHENLRLIINRI
jgi:uncharacterized protein (TIGR02145 family)